MMFYSTNSPKRPKGRNPTAPGPPVGVSAQELQYHAFVSFGDRPRAPNTIDRKAARTCRPMKACPWGWNRLNGKALLPLPRSWFRLLQLLGRDPHGQTSSEVGEKLQTKSLSPRIPGRASN